MLYEGQALPHFNEVDECAGLDALVTNRVWTRAGLRSGDHAARCALRRAVSVNGREEFVWVFEISGAVPPAHLIGRVRGRGQRAAAADVLPAGRRQPEGRQQAGRDRLEPRLRRQREAEGGHRPRARSIELPQEETERRWQITTPQWPIMHAVLYGVTRDQMMARHKSNHVQVAYAPDAGGARTWRWRRRPRCSARWGSKSRSAAPITGCRAGWLKAGCSEDWLPTTCRGERP